MTLSKLRKTAKNPKIAILVIFDNYGLVYLEPALKTQVFPLFYASLAY